MASVSAATLLVTLSPIAVPRAVAQDVTIETEETAPVDTSERLGPDPATLTIADTGSIVLSDGTIITLNGPHSLVLNGSLSSGALTNASGIFVDTSDLRIAGDITLSSNMNLSGDIEGDNASATVDRSGLFGMRFAGANGFEGDVLLTTDSGIGVRGIASRGLSIETAFTGNITTELGTTISALGSQSVAVALNAPIVGDVTFSGGIEAVLAADETAGEGLVGVEVTGEIDGQLTFAGGLAVGRQAEEFDGSDLGSARGGVIINRSITGGLLFEGAGENNEVDTDGDGVVDSILNSATSVFGAGATVRIENTATDGSDLRLGTIGNADYGLVSRGVLLHTASVPGLDSVVIDIGGGAGGAVIIDGGIQFDGSNNQSLAIDGSSTLLRIGAGASVPEIRIGSTSRLATTASISVTFDEDGEEIEGAGGSSTVIDILEGATVPTINSGGVVVATANGTDVDATVIRDRSNTLRSVTNTGSLEALVPEGAGQSIAIDVSGNSIDFDFTNSGTVEGDILLGSGSNTITFTGGTMDGAIVGGTGLTAISLSDALLVGGISGPGQINLTTDNAQIGLDAGVPVSVSRATLNNGTALFAEVDLNNSLAGRLDVANTLTVNGGLDVEVFLTDFIVAEQDFVIVDAANFVGVEDADLSISSAPFLFTSTLSIEEVGGRDQIVLSVVPRPADELGLEGQLVDFYEYLQTDFDPSAATATALANASNENQAFNAVSQLAPDFSNRLFEGALINQRILGRNFSERMDDYLRGEKNPTGLWAVEHGAIGDIDTEISRLNGDYLNFGLSVGYTGRLNDNFAIGVGAGFSLFGSESERRAGADISVFAPYVTAYAIANTGGLYAGLSGSATYLDVSRDRQLFFVDGDPLIQSETNGWHLNGTFEAGYALNAGNFKIKPYGQLTVNRVSENGYSEIGGAEALTVGDRSVNLAEAAAGISISYDIITTKRADFSSFLRPEIYAGIDRRIGGGNVSDLDVRFQNSEQSLDLTADQLGKNTEFAGAALSFFGVGTVARIRYQLEERGFVRAHSATLNFKLQF